MSDRDERTDIRAQKENLKQYMTRLKTKTNVKYTIKKSGFRGGGSTENDLQITQHGIYKSLTEEIVKH